MIPGPVNFTLYVLSDTYLGLDQQYEIQMNVIPNEIPSSTLGEIEESPSYKLF